MDCRRIMRNASAVMLTGILGCATPASYVKKSASTPGRYAVLISGKGLMGFAYDSLRMAGFSESEIICVDSDDYKHYTADAVFTRKNIKHIFGELADVVTQSDWVVVYLGPDLGGSGVIKESELEDMVEKIKPLNGLLVQLLTQRKALPLRFYDGLKYKVWQTCPNIIFDLREKTCGRLELPL